MTERGPGQLLCPSAKAEVGAILIGIVGADGVVGYVQPQIAVDAEFLDRAREGRQPEKRLRFAQPCVESGCGYWTGSSCGVIAEAVEHPAPPVAVDHLPRCSIRKTCRWFAQTGPRACGVCPYIVTDLSDDGTLVRHADVPSERLADALAITE
jgi:hypothetical protein